ncbi:MAG: response regulator transcription factor [Rubrivivax sp.]|nr:MAG: response regulator transcription factor [Rubrivivax sp.]
MRIAVLDDDQDHRDLVLQIVERAGHGGVAFSEGAALLRQLQRDVFDLLIVDWQMPGMSGVDVVRWVRANLHDRLPVLFVTQRDDERDVVEALACGADDYMSKPVRVHELRARVSALLRRSYPSSEETQLMLGHYRLDLARREAFYGAELIDLKPREFELARCLFMQRGRLLSRDYLLQTVWGLASHVPSRTLDTHMSSLRAKLALRSERGVRLTAVYGLGYRLEETQALQGCDDQPAAPDAGAARCA